MSMHHLSASSWILLLLLSASVFTCISNAATGNASPSGAFSFQDSFDLTGAEDHFRTSPDGQVWYLSLDKKAGAYIFVLLFFCFDSVIFNYISK